MFGSVRSFWWVSASNTHDIHMYIYIYDFLLHFARDCLSPACYSTSKTLPCRAKSSSSAPNFEARLRSIHGIACLLEGAGWSTKRVQEPTHASHGSLASLLCPLPRCRMDHASSPILPAPPVVRLGPAPCRLQGLSHSAVNGPVQ